MSIELARPGVWRVRWREGGRNRSKIVGRRRDAEAFDAEVRRRRRLGELALMDRGTESLADFVQEWYANYAAPSLEPKTIDLYEWLLNAQILPTLGALPLRELTPETIAAWRAALAKDGLGVESQRKALKLLRGILQRALEWRRIPDNPARLVRLPVPADKPEVRPIPPEKVEAIRAHLLEEDRRDYAALVSLLAHAGLRPQEALALSWGHVRERTLLIERRMAGGEIRRSTKNRQNRTVRLLAPVVQELRELRLWQRRPAEETLIFQGPGGRPWKKSTLGNWNRRVFSPAKVVAGLSDATPYTLRHSFASLLIWEGRPITYVAAQLGHSPTMTLRTYAQVFEKFEDAERVTAEEAIQRARGKLVPPQYLLEERS
jgi:integrase